VILADGTLPSVIHAYATLVSPKLGSDKSFAASLALPPLSQFGHLASSLTLAAEKNAQSAIIDFVKTSRRRGFPVDSLHLSPGWYQGLRSQDYGGLN
jgi:alpha-glucosidase